MYNEKIREIIVIAAMIGVLGLLVLKVWFLKLSC